jgi:hypothetical protein
MPLNSYMNYKEATFNVLYMIYCDLWQVKLFYNLLCGL